MSILPPNVLLLLSLLATTPVLAESTPEAWDTVAARPRTVTLRGVTFP